MLASSGGPPLPPRVQQRAGRDTWRGWLVHPFGSLLLEPSTLPVDDGVGYSLSKSIYDLRTTMRAPYVSAAPARCRKVVYPRGCTARPVSRLRTAVSSADRVESLGFLGATRHRRTPHLCVWV